MIVNLRQLREDRGETIDEAAEAMGVPKSTLARTERGESVPRHPATRLAIAEHFNLKPSEVWPVREPTEEAAAA